MTAVSKRDYKSDEQIAQEHLAHEEARTAFSDVERVISDLRMQYAKAVTERLSVKAEIERVKKYDLWIIERLLVIAHAAIEAGIAKNENAVIIAEQMVKKAEAKP